MGAPDDTAENLATTEGRPPAGMEIRIVDGEVRLRGEAVCQGYLDPAQTAEAFDEDGFLITGDVGRLTESGHLVLTGRLKDVIIRKGENISAKEIEDLLHRHPAVGDVAVIGLPDADRGERVCAVVEQPPGAAELTLAVVVSYLRGEGLSVHKIPEQLEVVDALPRNETLRKVLKYKLRERFSGEGCGWGPDGQWECGCRRGLLRNREVAGERGDDLRFADPAVGVRVERGGRHGRDAVGHAQGPEYADGLLDRGRAVPVRVRDGEGRVQEGTGDLPEAVGVVPQTLHGAVHELFPGDALIAVTIRYPRHALPERLRADVQGLALVRPCRRTELGENRLRRGVEVLPVDVAVAVLVEAGEAGGNPALVLGADHGLLGPPYNSAGISAGLRFHLARSVRRPGNPGCGKTAVVPRPREFPDNCVARVHADSGLDSSSTAETTSG
jgi:hypothetical protein